MSKQKNGYGSVSTRLDFALTTKTAMHVLDSWRLATFFKTAAKHIKSSSK